MAAGAGAASGAVLAAASSAALGGNEKFEQAHKDS